MIQVLSIIIPAFNEEKMIPITSAKVSEVLEKAKINYEMIFIDDGSNDNTWNEIYNQRDLDDRIVGIQFSKNFGKESAIFAGLEKARGNCCVVLY